MPTDARSKWLLLGGTGVVALGSMLPWATVNAGFMTATKAGTDGDGIITLLLALLAGGLALVKLQAGLSRRVLITSLVIGVIIGAIAVYDIVDVSTTTAETEYLELSASVGIGLWLTLLGSIAMVVGAIWELRSPTRVEVPTVPGTWAPPPTSWQQPGPPPYAGEQPPAPPAPPAPPTSAAPPPQSPPPPAQS